MNEATLKYSKQRDTQKRTKREAENWPEGGYEALRKLAVQMHQEVKILIDEPAASRLEHADYYKEVFAGKPPWQCI